MVFSNEPVMNKIHSNQFRHIIFQSVTFSDMNISTMKSQGGTTVLMKDEGKKISTFFDSLP